MQLLTTSGYKNIEDCQIGEQLIAYEVGTGNVIINELLGKQWFSPDMFEDEYSEPDQVVDEDGNPVFDEDGNPVMTEPVLIKTKEQVFIDKYGELEFYTINGTWQLYENQSVWANMNVCHAKNLKVGDVIYDNDDNDITITSIVKNTASGWWRLSVSGDHSYIMDNLTLHNASRYWVGGGASANWNATGNTNWGSSSGGTNNTSVPTSADDVIFDGAGTNGNTDSTISATITILSLTITTGYTSTMTHNAVLTIAGNWTYVNTYTIAGTSGITISATSTITSNGTTWSNNLTFSGSNTKTLVGNLTVTGTFATSGGTSGSTVVNATTTETLTIGGLTVQGAISGTADIYLTGGTWSASSASPTVNSNLFINGNVTFSGNIYKSNNTLTYLSGTVTTTGSTLNIGASTTLNTNGINWNNLTTTSTNTITLTSNLTIGGLLNITATTTINRTVAETVTCAGGIGINAVLSGTAEIIWTGGTWSQNNASNRIVNNLTINGNVTFGNEPVYSAGTLTYQSGNITWSPAQALTFRDNAKVDLKGILVGQNVTVTSGGMTLLSNLVINGNYTNGTTISANATTNETITVFGNFSAGTGGFGGTAKVIVKGGIMSSQGVTIPFTCPVELDGNITFGSIVSFQSNTVTYKSGRINAKNSLVRIHGSATLIGFNKIPLTRLEVLAGNTLICDQLPVGSPESVLQISSTGANYTIAFQDTFEKIGRNVAISGATLSRPMQLLLATNTRFNTNKSNSTGIRYCNQSPNGFAKNVHPLSDKSMTGGFGGLVGDPSFQKQG